MAQITRVEIQVFGYEVPDLELPAHGAAGVGNWCSGRAAGCLQPLRRHHRQQRRGARRLRDPLGRHAGRPGPDADAGAASPGPRPGCARGDLRRSQARGARLRPHGPRPARHRALGPRRQAPGLSVARLLGGFRTRLPTYASTYHGQDRAAASTPGGLRGLRAGLPGTGFAGFKIHGWHDGDARREAANVLGVRGRGRRLALMIDPACELRTWMDALYVGRACDEAGYFWYEDPYRDSGGLGRRPQAAAREAEDAAADQRACPRARAEGGFMLAGGCDMIHADPEYDMGITGAMKIAHFCEALGLDVQFHACGPAHRAASRRSATPTSTRWP